MLTDTTVKNLKPRERPFKKADAGGLFILVSATGAKLWRFSYRFAGKQRSLALGIYPEVSLAMARERRAEARRLLAEGKDPNSVRKAEARAAKAAKTFAAVADEWLQKKIIAEGKAPATETKARWAVSALTAKLADRPVGEIVAADILDALKPIAAAGHLEKARRVRAIASRVFRFAVAHRYCLRDPAADLVGALTAPQVKHRAAITDPNAVGALMRAIDGYASPLTRSALKLLALTFVRPGELRAAEWHEFDLEAAIWTIPASRMKSRAEHRVPLSRQALDELKALQRLSGGQGFIFPANGKPRRPMSENTLNAALRRMDYDAETMTAHGFRAMASTSLNETGKFDPDVIERCLAHVEPNAVRKAYNRAKHWPARVVLMQAWADLLDGMATRGAVVPLHANAAG